MQDWIYFRMFDIHWKSNCHKFQIFPPKIQLETIISYEKYQHNKSYGNKGYRLLTWPMPADQSQ